MCIYNKKPCVYIYMYECEDCLDKYISVVT